MRSVLLFFAVLFGITFSGHADDAGQIGPVTGSEIAGFSAVSQTGAELGLEDITGEKGVVLVFYRSADWCPFCKKQLINLNVIDEQTAEAGWPLVGISYDSPETLTEFATRQDLSFPLLSDTDSAMITAFGLLNDQYQPGSRAYGIPHPAIVFVSKDGVVRSVLREEGYRTRPERDLILETITTLNAAE